MGVYHFASRTKTRDKIATMFNILIIYSSKKETTYMTTYMTQKKKKTETNPSNPWCNKE